MKRLLNSSKKSANLPKVVAAEASYTGGGIYVFLGELSDGTYFIADYPYFDLRIVNEDPRPTYWDDFNEDGASYVPWQETHLIKDVPNDTTKNFFKDMFKWILKNNPEGNYNSGDIEDMLEDNNDR